jgi:hypothetical protein
VSTRAVDGAATEAVLRAVARALGVRRHQVRLVRDATSGHQLLEVLDAPTTSPTGSPRCSTPDRATGGLEGRKAANTTVLSRPGRWEWRRRAIGGGQCGAPR